MTEEIITTPEVQTPPSWFIDEGIPGIGDRPQWLPEKFKNVGDLAKSYHELEKKVGTAPEEYDFSGSKFLDQDYAPIQELLALAKEKRVPKEVMDKMLDSVDKYMDEFSIDYEEETKKLGDNAKDRLSTLDNWAKANLSEDSYVALTSNLKSAESIKALEELRGRMMSGNSTVPNGNSGSTMEVETLDQVRADLSANLGKYKTDPVYQKEIRARLEAASKGSEFIDKAGY
jgi:hypothetical protein